VFNPYFVLAGVIFIVSEKILQLSLNPPRAVWAGQVLPLTLHWFYVYVYAALKQEEGFPEVLPEEIGRLPTWRDNGLKSIRTGLFRHVQDQKKKGVCLWAFPENAVTKVFWLDPDQVSQVIFDIPLEQVRIWLELSQGQALQKPCNPQAAQWLMLCQRLFELGKFLECERYLERTLEESPLKDQYVEAWALKAWIEARRGNNLHSKDMTAQLVKEVEASVLEDRKALPYADTLSPQFRALAYIQHARACFYLRLREETLEACQEAEKYLEAHHHRELAGVAAARGFVSQWTERQHIATERFYREALNQATKAGWLWSAQIQMGNLAVVLFQRFEQTEDKQTLEARELLDEAIALTRTANEICNAADFGGSVETDTNLGYGYRLKGDYETALKWLENAERVTERDGSDYDLAQVLVERAEVYVSQGKRRKAIAELQRAIVLFTQIGNSQWLERSLSRLAELEVDGVAPVRYMFW
jgi:tetratricopeptide (TPR) repeat protein